MAPVLTWWVEVGMEAGIEIMSLSLWKALRLRVSTWAKDEQPAKSLGHFVRALAECSRTRRWRLEPRSSRVAGQQHSHWLSCSTALASVTLCRWRGRARLTRAHRHTPFCHLLTWPWLEDTHPFTNCTTKNSSLLLHFLVPFEQETASVEQMFWYNSIYTSQLVTPVSKQLQPFFSPFIITVATFVTIFSLQI